MKLSYLYIEEQNSVLLIGRSSTMVPWDLCLSIFYNRTPSGLRVVAMGVNTPVWLVSASMCKDLEMTCSEICKDYCQEQG